MVNTEWSHWRFMTNGLYYISTSYRTRCNIFASSFTLTLLSEVLFNDVGCVQCSLGWNGVAWGSDLERAPPLYTHYAHPSTCPFFDEWSVNCHNCQPIRSCQVENVSPRSKTNEEGMRKGGRGYKWVEMKGGLRDLTILTYKRRHVSLVMMVALWLCSLQLQSLWLHLLFPQQSFIFSHRWAILICLVCLFVFVSVYLSLFVDTNKIVCFWQYLFFNACLWLSVLSLSVTFLATLPLPLYVSVCLSFGLSSFLFVLLYLSLLKMFVPSSLSLCYRPRLDL